jgi:gamma-glutamylcyclotransferase (GGCT)/AIG2-like uncharacterized protein YtfP
MIPVNAAANESDRMPVSTRTERVLLFSYGTLQNRNVQIALFGRELTGRDDALPGYARRILNILAPEVAALTRESHLVTVEPSTNVEDVVYGTVFVITDQELAAADTYEASAGYKRVSEMLRSGGRAWVYVRA